MPSCPEWDATDLLWHLTEVQLFWGAIVAGRLDDPQAADAAAPDRPDSGAALAELFTTASADLADALATTPPDTPMWMWNLDGRHAGYVARRQAHEALIHRIDAELTAGRRTPVDAALATDGIDEVLSVMHGPASWGTVLPAGPVGRVQTSDTGARWDIRVGQFRGTDPESGKSYFEPVIQILDGGDDPDFVLTGTAVALDTALWNRAPLRDLDVSGDRSAFGALADLIAAGID